MVIFHGQLVDSSHLDSRLSRDQHMRKMLKVWGCKTLFFSRYLEMADAIYNYIINIHQYSLYMIEHDPLPQKKKHILVVIFHGQLFNGAFLWYLPKMIHFHGIFPYHPTIIPGTPLKR